nr:hypothetical protein [Tanacetum cinerariifolium]
MIPEPGDPNREVPVNETFHVQTNDELTKKELKQIEADDQSIQTILLSLPEDIYAAVDRIQEKKAKLFNEWEMFTSNYGESIESYYHCFLKLMNDLKRNKHFLEKIASNLKFLNNLQPEWSRHVTIVYQIKDLHTADYTQLYDFLKYNQKEVDDLKTERLAKTQDPLALMATSNNPYTFLMIHQDQPSFNQNYMHQPMPNPEDNTDPTTAMNMALALMAKAFKLNYSTPTNNIQRISSNPHIVGCTMVSLHSLTLSHRNFCLHRMVYESKYYKSCMGETCNMRIDTIIAMTDDELTEKEFKQIEADDQAIQTILLDLPEDIYAAVDSCETA